MNALQGFVLNGVVAKCFACGQAFEDALAFCEPLLDSEEPVPKKVLARPSCASVDKFCHLALAVCCPCEVCLVSPVDSTGNAWALGIGQHSHPPKNSY